jgi:Uma2 family endonuclease
MALAKLQPRLYTPDEYLALEEVAADYKSEYFRGEIYAMAGGSANHNRISGNVHAVLNNGLRSTRCETFNSDMRLMVKAHNLYTYPDTMVICGSIEFAKDRNDTVTNPTLIVEVLSPSTQDYDRGQKFEFYRALASLKDYLIIHQDQIYIEYYHKLADRQWVLTEFSDIEATLTIQSLNFEIPIRRLYERVDWLSNG